jgi:hypothetical protein
VHRSTAFGYEVESAWVTSFFLGLRRDHRAARLQAHTHPGRAGHSDTDDRFALVPAEGFISLVIPHFGLGAVTLERAVLVRMNEAGEWRPRPLWEVEAV